MEQQNERDDGKRVGRPANNSEDALPRAGARFTDMGELILLRWESWLHHDSLLQKFSCRGDAADCIFAYKETVNPGSVRDKKTVRGGG
jgi:hypothetical protein